MRYKYLLITIIFIITLTACNNDNDAESNEKTKKEETKTEQEDKELKDENTQVDKDLNEDNKNKSTVSLDDFEPIPTDVNGLASQSQGKFAEVQNIYDLEDEIGKEMKNLAPLDENSTEEDYQIYLRKMYWLVTGDYPNPEDVIKKWEFASFGNPDLPDSKFHFKESYNVEIILDSSGSMANPAGNGTRMDVAKKSIKQFLSKVPEEANVSLRVYGHKGTGADSDKEMSCNAIEQVYGFNSYNEGKFQKALNQFKPMGWTPLADALKQSQDALSQFDSKKNTNLIYVVSDGIETCDGDPVAVAKELSKSNAQPIINIIGFQTDAEAQKQLEKMAEVSGGIFASASNEEELQAEFDRAEEALKRWKKWKEDSLNDIDVQRVENNFDILEVHNDYSFTTLATRNKLNSFADVLQNIGYMSHEQKEKLKDKIKITMDEIEKTGDQLEEDMEEISKQSIEEAKKMVEEKYRKQTTQDN